MLPLPARFSAIYRIAAFVCILFCGVQLHALSVENSHYFHDTDGIASSEAVSTAIIPGFYPYFDIYSYWDTMHLDPYNFDFKSLGGTVELPVLESDCGFALPVAGALTSPFGWRWGRQHAGVDLQVKTGDTVGAAFDGVVRMSMWYYGYGNCVVIRHHNGIETLYGHLSKRLVEVGDLVNAGQVIGLGGSTGHSTGPHLHFETRFMGKAFNPQNLIDFKVDSLLQDTLVFDTNSFSAPPPQVYYRAPYKKRSYKKSSYYRYKSPARKSSYKKK
jgi:murein DD-endopeptidase MepM/ murein hydrolase activator NlpD